MSWMRRFAKIWSRSQSHLTIAREWLSLAWALIGGPRGFAPLLNNTAMQKQMRWMLRLSEALLRLAITERAKMITVPPLTSVRGRLGGGALLPPLDRPDAPYVARFRLDAPDDRWAIRPPNKAPLIRKPRQPIALLFRLMACQDGLDRFEILARKEARRWRQSAVTQQVLRHAPSGGEAVDQWHPQAEQGFHRCCARWNDTRFETTTPSLWGDGGEGAAAPEMTRHHIHHGEGVGETDAHWDPLPWIPTPRRDAG